MFRQTICAMTAWAALSGAANAQPPDADPIAERKGPGEPETLPAREPAAPAIPQPPTPRSPRFGRPKPVIASVTRESEPVSAAKPGPVVGPTQASGSEIVPPSEPVPPAPIETPPAVAARRFGNPLAAPPGRAWTRVEWLLWAASGQHVPPAITTSPFGTPANFAGIIPNPGTEVLFPTDRANGEFRSGFRLTTGFWLDQFQSLGVEGDFFFLRNSKKGLTVSSGPEGFPIIGRPFENALTGAPAAILVAYPGLNFGALSVRSENWTVGGGVNVLRNLRSDGCNRLDLVLGYRYLGVFDEVSFEQDSTALAARPGVPFATRTQVLDRFNTENNFHGAVLGLNSERKFGYWFIGARGTVAIGGVQQVAIIDGRTVITPASGPVSATFQGLYTQSTNIGTFGRNWFAVVPEVSIRAGVQFSESARFYIGYNWLYLSTVARAGDQIDTRVNPNFLPASGGTGVGPQLPGFQRLMKTDFWMQGVSFGMDVKF